MVQFGASPRSPECKEDMAHWKGDFLQCGFDYNIVSILGPQSGGKSTLLNMLFHTQFAIMDDSRRQQTTKGTRCAPGVPHRL